MPKVTTSLLVQRDGGIAIAPNEGTAMIAMVLRTKVAEDTDDGEYVARFPALPGRLGIGDTADEARDSLVAVVTEWITLFAEHNGLDKLQAYFVEQGFQMVPRPFVRPELDDPSDEFAVLNLPVPRPSREHA